MFVVLLCIAARSRTYSCNIPEGHKWRIMKLGDKTYESEIEITAVFAEQKMYGSTGVNWYNGLYKCGKENSISISSGAVTEVAGMGERLNAEDQFLEALQSAVRYHVDDDTLVLFDAARVVLIVFSNTDA